MTNKILVGRLHRPEITFEGDEVKEITGKLSASIIGDTLSIDTISAIIRADADDVPGDGEAIFWTHGDELKGKFWVREVTRTGVETYQVDAVSAVGLLERVRHRGGVYTGQTVETVITEIIGTAFTFDVDTAVAEQRVYGWLPYDSARNNLHKLMLAMGVGITKDRRGDVIFGFISAGTPSSVPDDRVFLLGGSVRRESVASRVEVVEHTFIASANGETVTAFDNTDGSAYADNRLVIFSDAPIHSLTAAGGLTINQSGPNWATVSGIGVLTGKKYAHVTQQVSKTNDDAPTENVKSVSTNTLINFLNGGNVLQRLYDYYTRSDTIGADIKITTELPNQLLTMNDAFREPRSAWLKSMDFRATTFIRASAELVADYVPGSHGNLYTAVERLTGSEHWYVPDGVTRVLVVLIGGGSGGSGGYDGTHGHGGDPEYGGDMDYLEEANTRGYYYRGGKDSAGSGGAGGEPGAPGKVFSAEIDVEPGEDLIVSGGAPGLGGDPNGGAGTAGYKIMLLTENSGLLSSDDGAIAPNGVIDLITGAVYARPASAGFAGGGGGITDTQSNIGNTGNDGLQGESVDTWTGGAGGIGQNEPSLPSPAQSAAGSGGGGGGAAYGHNGGNGDSGGVNSQAGGVYLIYGGMGGSGADADPPPTGNYGDGGGGGNGGGGGGNGGGTRFYGAWNYSGSHMLAGDPGAAGHGSRGGHGGEGVVLIYYKGAATT